MTATRTRNGRMWTRPRLINGVTVPGDTSVAPGPVTDHSISSTVSAITIRWTNPAGSTGTLIRRAAGGTAPATINDGTLIADVAGTLTAHTDSGLPASTQYSYGLWAHNAIPQYSTRVAKTMTTKAPVGDDQPPGPVTNVTNPTTGTDFLHLAWTNPVGHADFAGVVIRRLQGPTAPTITTGVLVDDVEQPGTAVIDTGLAPNTTYTYSLFAHDEVPNYAPRATTTQTTNQIVTGGVRPWWGWSAQQGDPQYNQVETWTGHPGEVRRIFVSGFPANYTTALDPIRRALNAARLPHWSCKAGTPSGYQALGTALNNMNSPILVTWHHEPEDDIPPLGNTFSSAADYRTKYNTFYDNIKLTCGPDVHVGPVLMAADWVQAGRDPMDWITPGKLDFLSVDGYNPAGRRSGQTIFTPCVATAAALDVPMVIGETSTQGHPPNVPNTLGVSDAIAYRWQWMRAFALWLETQPRIIAVQWFQSSVGDNDGDASWAIEQSLRDATVTNGIMYGTLVLEYETARQLGIHMAKPKRALWF